MTNPTNSNSSSPAHFVISSESAIDGRKLYLGEGSSKSQAWEDATGRPTPRRGWTCQKVTYSEAMELMNGDQG